MSEPQLRLTRTQSADNFQGALFGIEIQHFKFVLLSLLAGLAIFAFLFYARTDGFLDAAQWAGLPLVLCILVLKFGLQGRPPFFIADLVDSILTRGHAAPRQQFPPNPFLHD